MLLLDKILRDFVASSVEAVFKLKEDVAQLDVPPEPEFGDYSTSVCFLLAKKLRKDPSHLAAELVEYMNANLIPELKEAKFAPPAYVNLYANHGVYAKSVLGQLFEQKQKFGCGASKDMRVLVEHTSVNPNKALHIGHVRNSVLGDSLARIFKAAGYDVQVQNYIDDTGPQVADTVVGFKSLGAVAPEGVKFDHFCWDLYTEVNRKYEAEPEYLEHREKVLKAMEERGNDLAKFAKETASKVLDCHLETLARLGIYYDLLVWESDILEFKLWKTVFEMIKGSERVKHAEDGEHAGCWVLKLSDLPEFKDMKEPDKVLVRGTGVPTYTAKDIAYQIWKFGLLKDMFRYSMYRRQDDGTPLWTTSVKGGKDFTYKPADRVINVIDSSQTYPQKIVRLALKLLCYDKQYENSIHFAYEKVALTPKTCDELGILLDEDERQKKVVGMSGRKGIGVKADDLLDKLYEKAYKEVSKRNKGMKKDSKEKISKDISIAALKFYLLRQSADKVIAFDIEDALSLEGESGPYVQYAATRAKRILEKAGDSDFSGADYSSLEDEDELELLRKVLRYPLIVEKSALELSPSVAANYAYDLASAFNKFYNSTPVLKVKMKKKKLARLALVAAVLQVLDNSLGLLGISIPERM